MPTKNPIVLRPRDAAHVLAVSESQIRKFERDGLLTAIAIPVRVKRYATAQVEALAEQWITKAGAHG